MKKFILLILLISNLFGCTGAYCVSQFEDCYGLECIANSSSCYGDGCTAFGGSACYGDGCQSWGAKNPLPSYIVTQYPNIVFTRAKQLNNLQQQLNTTQPNNYLIKIKLNLQILQMKCQIDPKSCITNASIARIAIQNLIPNPVPEELQLFAKNISEWISRCMTQNCPINYVEHISKAKR